MILVKTEDNFYKREANLFKVAADGITQLPILFFTVYQMRWPKINKQLPVAGKDTRTCTCTIPGGLLTKLP